jgi:hypothetical protein
MGITFWFPVAPGGNSTLFPLYAYSIGVTGRNAKAEGPQHPFPGNTAGLFLFYVVIQEKTPHTIPQHARAAAQIFQLNGPTCSPQHQQQQQQQ